MKRTIRHISNKLTKTRALRRSKALHKYIPETRRMNLDVFNKMLHRYSMVYLKPCCGSLGQGVIRMGTINSRTGKIQYHSQTGKHVHRYESYHKAYRAITRETRGKPYLVQKGIRLLVYKHRPFDVRVMVQRNFKKSWEVTGVAGRLAHPHRIVTNGSQGGTIYPLEVLLKAYITKKKRHTLIKSIKKIALMSVKQLNNIYPGIREYGVDIAIDQHLKLWILEVNTRPDPCPFTKLNDKSMISRIIRYAKMNGSIYNLKCTKAKSSGARSR